MIKEKRFTVSSGELARITGLTDVQIRKDISNFGKIGTPRVGYDVGELKSVLEGLVLRKKVMRIALFGTGNLGTAILKYPGFRERELKIVAAFEKDRKKIGRIVSGVRIYSVDRAPKIIKKTCADTGIIAVPTECSQGVADLIVASGLKGIVNFAPVSLNVPENVTVRNIDLAIEFLSLFCDTQT